jgi:hypothetical protein
MGSALRRDSNLPLWIFFPKLTQYPFPIHIDLPKPAT